MALAKIQTGDISLKIFWCYAHILNEYAKEKEKNTTDWSTFMRVLLNKRSEYFFSIASDTKVVFVMCVVFS